MQNDVTSRFIQSLEFLKTNNKVPSTRQFALAIGVHPQCISDIVCGKRSVNCDIISKSIQTFKLNPLFLYTGEGSEVEDSGCSTKNSTDPILTIVTDEVGNERIVHVPVSAQAGYGTQLHDPTYVQDLPTFSLPGAKYANGSHRCFDVSGDSMEPSIYNGDKVVCHFVEPENWFNGIRENHVYVVISKEGVVVKRVVNNLKANGTLSLISDNNFYKPFEIELKDIVEIWQVSVKISPFMPSPRNIRNGLHNEMDMLKNTIADQSKMIQSLNATVEKLLKQNRTTLIR